MRKILNGKICLLLGFGRSRKLPCVNTPHSKSKPLISACFCFLSIFAKQTRFNINQKAHEENRHRMAKRDIKYGNDFFREIKNTHSQNTYNTCYWDLWIAILLTNQFNFDWEALARAIETDQLYKEEKSISLTIHIGRLKENLAILGFEISDILLEVDADFLKKQYVKAKKKVLDLDFQNSEKTDWMINTPEKILYEKALRGNWQNFPVNPIMFAVEFEKKFKKSGFYHENESFYLEKKLRSALDTNSKNATIPQLIALYRAFLSVILEKMNVIDNSYGNIGDLYADAFEQYTNIDRRELMMSSEAFLTDILELIIWEDYGLINIYESSFLNNLSPDEVSIAESILRNKIEMFWELKLKYQAENALTMLTILYARHKMFDKFVPLAKELETRHWQRITLLADTAKENGKDGLALQVFEACLVEGSHYNFLKEKYEKLKYSTP